MNKTALKSIQKVLRENKSKVSANKTWRSIHDECDIGCLSADQRSLILSHDDRFKLRELAEAASGADVLHSSLEGERTDIASNFINEKLSGSKVFGGLLWLCQPRQKPIHLLTGIATSPEGSFLAVPYDHIALDDSSIIVIVENGAALRRVHEAALPEQLMEQAVFIYRGHDTNQVDVVNLIESAPAGCQVIGFFDYDPEGIIKGLEMGVREFLVPSNWDEHYKVDPVASRFNNIDKYDEQTYSNNTKYSSSQTGVEGNELLGAVISGEWCLMQEHMIAHSSILTIVATG